MQTKEREREREREREERAGGKETAPSAEIRMQIDVVTHDATAHRSHTKSRREPAPGGVNE